MAVPWPMLTASQQGRHERSPLMAWQCQEAIFQSEKYNRSTIFATPFDMLKKVGLEFPWFRELSNAQRKSVLIHLSFCTRSICIEKPLAVCVY